MNSLAYPTVGLTRGRRKMLSARWVKAAALAGTMALGPVACGDSPGVESRHLEGVDAAARDQSGVTFEACVLAGLSVPAECGAVPVLTDATMGATFGATTWVRRASDAFTEFGCRGSSNARVPERGLCHDARRLTYLFRPALFDGAWFV